MSTASRVCQGFGAEIFCPHTVHTPAGTESEFRRGIIAPLLFLILLLGQRITWWLILPSLVALFVLANQGHYLRRMSRELLANSLYFGYTKLPVLKSLSHELQRMHLPNDAHEGTWMGATVVALHRLGEFDIAHEALREASAYLDEKDHFKDFTDYLQQHAPAYFELGRDNLGWDEPEPLPPQSTARSDE